MSNQAIGGWRAGSLFRRRMRRFWTEQWKAWRTALDWTVWVYVLVPAVWIAGGTYADLWHHPPSWLANLPLWTGERLPLVVVFAGRFRSFAEEADVLFLLQKRSWIQGLLLRGAAYTAGVLLLLSGVLYGALLPFFAAVHHYPAGAIVMMLVYTWIWSCVGAVWRNLIEARFAGFRKWLVKTAVTLLLAAAYLVPMIVWGSAPAMLAAPAGAGLVVCAELLRIKLRARDAFESDARQEQLARLASTQLLLRNVIERKPRVRLGRPVLLRRSNRLFRRFDGKTMLAEMIMKAFVRRMALIRTWLGFAFVSTAAVFLSPAVIQPFVGAALLLLLSTWIISHWRGMLEEPFFAQFRWTDHALRGSAGLVRFWLAAPAAALFGLAGGARTYGAWGLLAAVPAVLLWLLLSNIVTSTMVLRLDRKGKGA
ncbi:ABC-2 type transport system permease protein [Paenibacillus sp. UNC496MF]|uniref:ABC transporter permease n=1 Tax=Paenibacillus sp. UNC496MF TaxID=1502753 RepID=UPI0008E4445A|nr:ABC transporter permease [Paenibacillus sp. UNC496MF]SFI48710.1 ABC-2 type transport system permease protein [Paenibacillus sp. UNC496MF]